MRGVGFDLSKGVLIQSKHQYNQMQGGTQWSYHSSGYNELSTALSSYQQKLSLMRYFFLYKKST